MSQARWRIVYCGYEKDWWRGITPLLRRSSIACERLRMNSDFLRIANGAKILVVSRYQSQTPLAEVAEFVADLRKRGFMIIVVGSNEASQDRLFLEAGAQKVFRGHPESEKFFREVENLIQLEFA